MSNEQLDTSPAAESLKRPGNRRGPDRRQRSHQINLRVSADEAATLRAKAAAAGGSIGDLLRHAALAVPLPGRRQRRPAVELQPVAALLAVAGDLASELGKQGSNLNQLAHQANAGRFSPGLQPQIEDALARVREGERALLEIRAACLDVLGFERGGQDDD